MQLIDRFTQAREAYVKETQMHVTDDELAFARWVSDYYKYPIIDSKSVVTTHLTGWVKMRDGKVVEIMGMV
jgi:hypothetical protein